MVHLGLLGQPVLFQFPHSLKQWGTLNQKAGFCYLLETGPKYAHNIHEHCNGPVQAALPNSQPLGTSWCLLVLFQCHAVCNMSCFLLSANSKVASWALWGTQTSSFLLRTWLGPITHSAHFLFKKKYLCALSLPLSLKIKYCHCFWILSSNYQNQTLSGNFFNFYRRRNI